MPNIEKREEIAKIEGLGALANLRELLLGYNQIARIKGSDGLGNLEFFSLVHNQVAEVKGLDQLVRLDRFNLDGNPVMSQVRGKSAQELVYLSRLRAHNCRDAQIPVGARGNRTW